MDCYKNIFLFRQLPRTFNWYRDEFSHRYCRFYRLSHGNCDTPTCSCKNLSMAMTIWTAAEQGYKDHIVAKVIRDSRVVNKLDNYGYTALHYAAQHNHFEIVGFLLQNGASPDLHCCGATPLHRAAFAGGLESCIMLVEAGADVNVQDYSFGDLNTPCHKAAIAGHNKVVDYLSNLSAFDASVVNSTNQTFMEVMQSNSTISNEIQPSVDVVGYTSETVQASESGASISDLPLCDRCLRPSLSFAKGPRNMMLCLDCRYDGT